jgi:hypothetical protein
MNSAAVRVVMVTSLWNPTESCHLTAEVQLSTEFRINGAPAASETARSWNKAPIWGLRPDFYYCQTIADLLMWGALSHERTGLSSWPLPAQSFLGPTLVGLVTIFYRLKFETSLFVVNTYLHTQRPKNCVHNLIEVMYENVQNWTKM